MDYEQAPSKIKAELLLFAGSDISVVNAARVSFSKEVDCISDADKGLIDFLAREGHTTPFNHCFLSFRCKAPIFVARQMVKHEYLPFNEVSRRYVNTAPEYYMPDYIRTTSDKIKQGSLDTKHEESDFYMQDYKERTLWAIECYIEDIEKGIPAEQARMPLPLNIMTEWVWSGTLGAFMKMLSLRLAPTAQKETRDLAEQIAAYVKVYFPLSYEAIMKHGWRDGYSHN